MQTTDAFNACSALAAINVADGSTSYKSIEGVLFNKAGTTLIQYPCGKISGYQIPDGVTSINAYAFSYCYELTGVTIPASVTGIGGNAFKNCTDLTGAYFYGNAPAAFGANVFEGTAPGFTIYYLDGKSGWTNPWHGYPAATFVIGDMNGDKAVNILDLLFMATNTGQPATTPDAFKSDVNKDGQVNILDLLMVAQNISR